MNRGPWERFQALNCLCFWKNMEGEWQKCIHLRHGKNKKFHLRIEQTLPHLPASEASETGEKERGRPKAPFPSWAGLDTLPPLTPTFMSPWTPTGVKGRPIGCWGNPIHPKDEGLTVRRGVYFVNYNKGNFLVHYATDGTKHRRSNIIHYTTHQWMNNDPSKKRRMSHNKRVIIFRGIIDAIIQKSSR